jgi:hypothetical protein
MTEVHEEAHFLPAEAEQMAVIDRCNPHDPLQYPLSCPDRQQPAPPQLSDPESREGQPGSA